MPATRPYTPTVMRTAIPASTVTRVTNGAVATIPSVITMISADSTKSVRMAPLIFCFSSATRSTAGSASAAVSAACSAASSAGVRVSLCATFSNPS